MQKGICNIPSHKKGVKIGQEKKKERKKNNLKANRKIRQDLILKQENKSVWRGQLWLEKVTDSQTISESWATVLSTPRVQY